MDTVEITLPVSRAVAERWRDPQERARLGAVLSLALAAGADQSEAADAARLAAASREERERKLAEALAQLQQAVVEAGLTAGEVEAELAAWKRDRPPFPPVAPVGAQVPPAPSAHQRAQGALAPGAGPSYALPGQPLPGGQHWTPIWSGPVLAISSSPHAGCGCRPRSGPTGYKVVRAFPRIEQQGRSRSRPAASLPP
jgi:hypothetical protein